MKCGMNIGVRRQGEARAFQSSHHDRSVAKRTQMVVKALAKQSIVDSGYASLQGTSRKQNEDRLSLDETGTTTGGRPLAAVFDGHGGNACAEWLSVNFASYIKKHWGDGNAPEAAITEAFLAADRKVLAPKPGLFGMMGERGIGGSKCGATGAVAILVKGKTGEPALLAANAGDARVILGRGGKALQLTVDHVPDSEEERLRIEAQNPNPRQPLVRYVGGTWRVGGLLALSRAFGWVSISIINF
jgi:protein phosphatase 1K